MKRHQEPNISSTSSCVRVSVVPHTRTSKLRVVLFCSLPGDQCWHPQLAGERVASPRRGCGVHDGQRKWWSAGAHPQPRLQQRTDVADQRPVSPAQVTETHRRCTRDIPAAAHESSSLPTPLNNRLLDCVKNRPSAYELIFKLNFIFYHFVKKIVNYYSIYNYYKWIIT